MDCWTTSWTPLSIVQQLDEEIENLEDLLFAANANQESVQRRSFELRKSLVLLRGSCYPCARSSTP